MVNTQNCTKAKFKVGDKVRRVGETCDDYTFYDSYGMYEGEIYTIESVDEYRNSMELHFMDGRWNQSNFELVQEEQQVQNQEDLRFKLLVLQKENELLTRMLLQGGEL